MYCKTAKHYWFFAKRWHEHWWSMVDHIGPNSKLTNHCAHCACCNFHEPRKPALTEVKPPSCFNLPMPAMTLSRSLSQSISCYWTRTEWGSHKCALTNTNNAIITRFAWFRRDPRWLSYMSPGMVWVPQYQHFHKLTETKIQQDHQLRFLIILICTKNHGKVRYWKAAERHIHYSKYV